MKINTKTRDNINNKAIIDRGDIINKKLIDIC